MSFSSSSKEMPLRQHMEELRSRILRIVICIIIITVFAMSFGIKSIELDSSIIIYFPYPDPFYNIAIQITKYMQETLLPPEVKLIQTAPGQAFFSQIYVSVLIGFIGSMPIIVKETLGFISPAIEKKRKLVFGIYFCQLYFCSSLASYLATY